MTHALRTAIARLERQRAHTRRAFTPVERAARLLTLFHRFERDVPADNRAEQRARQLFTLAIQRRDAAH